MDVVSYTTYDGSQAVCSSLRMALRIQEGEGHGDRNQLLVPGTMNPETLSQIRDYCRGVGEIKTIGYNKQTGLLNIEELEKILREGRAAAVFFENPSYLGFFESQIADIAEAAHKAGALVIVQPDPASLGLVESPANYGADLVCGEIQSLGMHIQYGGGCAGFIASRNEKKYIEQFPTYFYGLTTTGNKGEFGYGRALNYRCSHGAREKAKEYFGTESGLWGISAGVYLALMGPAGMRELGERIIQKCHYAAEKLKSLPKLVSNVFNSQNFQEFVVNFDKTGKTVAEVNRRLLEYRIFGGRDLSGDFPELGQSCLFCVTETTSKAQIDALAEALGAITGA
jgi:glycine dehydrogenase subunit 1